MQRIFSGKSNPQERSSICYYCLQEQDPPPRDRRNFQCPHCQCTNRYDINDRIISDDPAMHVEELNRASYALRASRSKNKLPSLNHSNPLCQTCKTNQTLHIHLLSNYLPAPSDPDYQQLLDQLPLYKASLERRYLPLCSTCRPLVEEEIERKDLMARTTALGGWLRQSQRRDQEAAARRRIQEENKRRTKWFNLPWMLDVRQVTMWRIQGLLWSFTTLSSVAFNLVSLILYFAQQELPIHPRPVFITAFAILSRLWSEWGPTFFYVQRAIHRGRDMKLIGRSAWVGYQRKLWILRIFCAFAYSLNQGQVNWKVAAVGLSLEILLHLLSYLHFSIDERPRLLVSSHSSSRPPTPNQNPDFTQYHPLQAESDILASLSLSSNPLSVLSGTFAPGPASTTPVTPAFKPASNTKPVFGQTSLSRDTVSTVFSTSITAYDDPTSDGIAMDWDPIPSPSELASLRPSRRGMADEDWLKPQRFFGREQSTGLENLFQATSWLDDKPLLEPSTPLKGELRQVQRRRQWQIWLLGALGGLGLVFIGYVVGQIGPTHMGLNGAWKLSEEDLVDSTH